MLALMHGWLISVSGQGKGFQVNWLSSTVFMNRGDRFEARALPSEAQTSPAFGVVVGDWNGNGWEDLFLAQNFFAVEPGIVRNDAGRGLILEGNGKGVFTAVPGQVSGVKVYGQQRGAAAADFDQDGRLDLVVGQNGAATKLLRNQQGSPGLRVRLTAGETNPNGIGSILRQGNEKQLGPDRVVTAGGVMALRTA